ncbi:MAG: phosphate ABC transporter substrate-binding protein [Pseudomonadales bacterium]|nr:phosphate ABC transporter substrate-binding protein [Pseudomonadales bacterium]
MNRLCALIMIGLIHIAQADVYIIVNPDNHNVLSVSDVRNIFLGKVRSFPDGSTAIPVELKDGSTVREDFDQKILKKDDSQVRAYWAQMVFTGRATPPRMVDSEAELRELVAKNPNLIGYVGNEVGSGDVHTALKN